MPYSDVAGIRSWLKDITSAKFSDAEITVAIALGDRYCDLMLSKWPALLVDLPATEDYVRALGESATCEVVYRQAYSEEGESAENNDRKMWEAERDSLLNSFLQGRIMASVGPAHQALETNASRANRYPVFGYGEWSERVLSSIKPSAETGYPVRENLP